MPELPEVENVIRSLIEKVRDKTIKDVEVITPGITYNRENFGMLIEGKKIKDIARRGKYIIIKLDDGNLLIHLRMTGKLLYNGEVGKHTHLTIEFTSGDYLIYNDVRKFGRVAYLNNEELSIYLNTKVGLEPLLMDYDKFKEKLQIKKGQIKKVLLDQGVIAGIGNIYADEILFASNIHPMTEINKLTEEDFKLLYKNIRTILDRAIKAGGSTIRDYVNSEGVAGGFQDAHLAYGRCGLPCKNCGCTMEKIKVAGRTTVYCPICQRLR